MGRRRHERMKHVFPVRIWGKDKSGHSFDELAHTLDVSAGGALLAGIKHALRAGDVLSIQYKQKKAEFRVAWVGQPDSPKQGQIGVAAVDTEKSLWSDLAKADFRDKYPILPPSAGPTLAALQHERRSTRLKFRVAVTLQSTGEPQFKVDGHTYLVNVHGCGVESPRPIQTGVGVTVIVPSTKLSGSGRVVGCVSVGERLWAVGVDLDAPANLWGVDNPPGDWGHNLSRSDLGAYAALSPSSAPPAEAPRDEAPEEVPPPKPPERREPVVKEKLEAVLRAVQEDYRKRLDKFLAEADAKVEAAIARVDERLKEMEQEHGGRSHGKHKTGHHD